MSGTGLYLGDPSAPLAVQREGLPQVATGTADVLAAEAASAWHHSIGPRLYDWAARSFGEQGATLQPDEANARYGLPGVLTFDRPVSEGVASALRQSREADIRRQSIIARRDGGLATSAPARSALDFAVAVLDPVNVAASLIPVGRYGRAAAVLGGIASPALRRLVTGAIEGGAGMALLEPAERALSHAEFNDRTAAETLASIAFGSVLGGGLHVLGGAAADAVRARRTPLQTSVETAGPAAREAALRGAVAALAEGRPVEVAPVFDLPSAPSYRRVTEQAADGAYAAFTPGGVRIEARPEVVDLSQLIPSHTPDGAVNPAYPHAEGLQPRDRSTAGSQDQIQAIAANLQPERLMPAPEAGAGAPIVDARGVVESGNGRVAALQRVYDSPDLAHRAEAYRAYLEAQGYDLTGIDRPVLVGRRISELDAEQARNFTRGANERATLDLTAAEQARADADRAGRIADQLQPGALTSQANRDFVRAFLAQLPPEERGKMLLGDGALSAAGEARIRQALLAHAYGDGLGPLLERLLNGDVDNMRAIAGALADSAGPWSQMRAAAGRGEIPGELDITAALGEAVQLVEQARRAGRPLPELLAQSDAFAAPPSPAVLGLVRLMHRDDALARPLGREPLAEMMARYADAALHVQPGPDLFGGAPATAADILRAVARHLDPEALAARALDDLAGAARVRPEDAAASRMAQEAAQKAAQADARPAATPLLPGEAPPAAQRLLREADAHIEQLRKLDLDPAEQAELRALDDLAGASEAEARATEAAAACLIGER